MDATMRALDQLLGFRPAFRVADARFVEAFSADAITPRFSTMGHEVGKLASTSDAQLTDIFEAVEDLMVRGTDEVKDHCGHRSAGSSNGRNNGRCPSNCSRFSRYW